MSVYQRKASALWHYDFQLEGRRFHGSTGQKSRRAAEKVEAELRLAAKLGQLDDVSRYTIDQAAGRWWLEVGQRRGDAAKLKGRVKALVGLFDGDPKLSGLTIAKLDQAAVARAIETRRGQPFVRSKQKDARQYARANGTVNRDVVETLRPILKRAATHWGAKGLPAIDWRTLRLREPPELVRVYSPAEEAAWLGACEDSHGRLALDLMLTYGLRFGELFFAPAAYDASGPRLAWMKGRKFDVPHTVPLLERHAREIAARAGRAAAAKLDHIWFVETPIAGEGATKLESLTRHMLEGRISRAADAAGIAGGRRIHGARHHAGTRVLRQTKGNLKAAQRLLGHSDIRSTMRYAHLLEDDLRAILEAGEAPAAAAPLQRKKGKRRET